MLILKRVISPYNGSDLILGIFSTLADLNSSKLEYIKLCEDYDLYSEQANKSVNLEEDIITLTEFDSDVDSSPSEVLYLVYSHTEGFGQEVEEITCLYDSEKKAKDKCKTMTMSLDENEWPIEYDYYVLNLNVLNYKQESLFVRFKSALIENNTRKMEQYLESGFCFNSNHGDSLLHSIIQEDLEVIRRTINLGVDINSCNESSA